MITANFLNSSEVTTDRLFQWDIGQKIQLLNIGTATAPNVHFCNKKSDNALVVTSSGSDGTYTANIPNTLLAEEYDITAFIYIGDNTEAKTIKVIHIPVTKRTKPSSYIYTTDEDVIDFMAISAEIHSLLDGLIITPYDSTKSYIKPNIVYYQGQTYICKSETTITGVLPTDTTSWGLMCKNGANISQITFSNDTLHFKLDSNDIIDVPLNSVLVDVVNDLPAFDIREDSNGVLTIKDYVIRKEKLVSNTEVDITNNKIQIGGISTSYFLNKKYKILVSFMDSSPIEILFKVTKENSTVEPTYTHSQFLANIGLVEAQINIYCSDSANYLHIEGTEHLITSLTGSASKYSNIPIKLLEIWEIIE
ncbi:MAG: hypothetical protein MSS83_05365 [Methanobrevibacter sp.]|uniref:hypothetical protein n=1 Tax=Methanobrevibacter sp. TaxID=66852 RepID=UPI0031F4DC04|nr:hypothetical protein [Methanobrevibacter sp.]